MFYKQEQKEPILINNPTSQFHPSNFNISNYRSSSFKASIQSNFRLVTQLILERKEKNEMLMESVGDNTCKSATKDEHGGFSF